MIDYGAIVDKMTAAGLPVGSISVFNGIPNIRWNIPNPTQFQIDLANSMLADPLNAKRKPRALIDIYTDITGISPPDQLAIFNDLNSGTPKKYLQSSGMNAAAIAVFDWVVQYSGVSPANLNQAKLRLIAMYVQDNPLYLNHASFAPTVVVLGDMLA